MDAFDHFDSPAGYAWANAVEADDLPRLGELAANSDVQLASASGMSPLGWALERNRPASFSELLRLGAQPDTRTIQAALREPAPRYAQLLLRARWNPNTLDPNGHPWLFTPLLARNATMFRLLVENGADVNAARPDGVTPLIALITLGDYELAFWLLERGADPSATTSTGATAASRAGAMPPAAADQAIWRQRVIDSLRFRGFTAGR